MRERNCSSQRENYASLVGERYKEIEPIKKMCLGKRTYKKKISVKKAVNVLRLLLLGRTTEFKLNKDAVGQVVCIICGIGLYEKEKMKNL